MNSSRPLRVGWISYVNTAPLLHALSTVPDIVVDEQVPTELNRRLARGEIDVGLISSIELARHPDEYARLDGLSISADGPVRSVLVASHRPVPTSRSAVPDRPVRIHLTPDSATSAVMLRILSGLVWETAPFLELTTDPTGADGRLLIGDEALREHLYPRFPHQVDLAFEWKLHTGLPMVFALFCVRREVLSGDLRKVLERLHAVLVEAAREPDRERAAREEGGRLGLPVDRVLRYFEGLSYGLTERHERGIQTFFDLARRVGAVGSGPGTVRTLPPGVDRGPRVL